MGSVLLVIDVQGLSEAFGILSDPVVLMWLIVGAVLGIFIGSIPGIGGAIGMAILLPLTFPLDGHSALFVLLGIYSGSCFAGSVPSILMKTPGSASGAAAIFEGYPLAQQGRAKEAISAAAASSAIGGTLGLIVLFLSISFLYPILLLFGAPEYFLVTLLGLSLIAIITKGPIVKGYLAGFFGLMITSIGYSLGGTTRYTFGQLTLYDGIEFVAVILGVFAIAEMYSLSKKGGTIAQSDNVEIEGSSMKGLIETLKRPVTLAKSGLIGMIVGAVPGAGAAMGTFVSYAEAIRSTGDKDSFGIGNLKGVVAVDAASNGVISGALVPTLAFGIPGGGATAILIGGMLMHGFPPGAALLGPNIGFTYSLLIGIFLGNVVIFVVGVFFINKTAIVTRLDVNLLIPVVIVLAIAGSYTLRANWVDVGTVFLFGILGYYMNQYNYSVIALMLGVILGGISEDNMLRSLQLSGMDWTIFVESPLSKVLVVVLVVSAAYPLLARYDDQILHRLRNLRE